MTTAAIQKPKGPQRLKRADIRYLALEGGGGKGFAYLGALQVLENFQGDNVLSRLEGVAGTSAGAITALMLALGLTTREIEEQIDQTDFNLFYDRPQPRLIPQPALTKDGGYARREDSATEKLMLGATLDTVTILTWLSQARQGNNFLDLYQSILSAGLVNLVLLRGDLALLLAKQKPPVGVIAGFLNAYLAYLGRDMGFFSGAAARTYFDTLIATTAARRKGGKPADYINMPFVRFQSIFGRELMVCGANLSTGRTVLFSARREHTPYFPVADAVRISMGLPMIFKPYVIDRHVPGWPPCGTYVDGGYWNNLPFREIAPRSGMSPGQSSSAAVGDSAPRTLALRLQIDTPTKVITAGDVLSKMLNSIAGAGETQILSDFAHLAVTLDTTGLSLLEFSPNPAARPVVTKRARRRMLRYFGHPVPPADEDKADDARVAELEGRDVCN